MARVSGGLSAVHLVRSTTWRAKSRCGVIERRRGVKITADCLGVSRGLRWRTQVASARDNPLGEPAMRILLMLASSLSLIAGIAVAQTAEPRMGQPHMNQDRK